MGTDTLMIWQLVITIFDGLERLDGSEFKKESFSINANFFTL